MSITGRTINIEHKSIEYISPHERHGRLFNQISFWFVGNFQPFTLALGFSGILQGLSIMWTIIASTLGIIIGTIFMAFHASQGPSLGLPQMIQSRAQFGYRGVIIPLIASLFTFLGFNTANIVIIKSGLHTLLGWNPLVMTIVVSLIAILFTLIGHDALHGFFKLIFYITLPAWIIVSVYLFSGKIDFNSHHVSMVHTRFTWSAFISQFVICAAYNITYAPYVSDFTRYLSHRVRPLGVISCVFIGAAGSPFFLVPVGAYVASHTAINEPLVAMEFLGDKIYPGFGIFIVICSCAALIASIAMNAYSALLATVTGFDSFYSMKKDPQSNVLVSNLQRLGLIIVLSIWWIAASLPFSQSSHVIDDGLNIMLCLLTPWTAINLIDFFIIEHGNYNIVDLIYPQGSYAGWSKKGIFAFTLGFIMELPFINVSFYHGAISRRLGDLDISFIIGLMVTGITYFIIRKLRKWQYIF